MITLFGISNCDTIKKTKKWLDQQAISYHFHDYRKQGIDPELVRFFCQQLGWNNVINQRGTTFRQLSVAQQELIKTKMIELDVLIELLVAQPAMIKRPILQIDEHCYVGFNTEQYAELLMTYSNKRP